MNESRKRRDTRLTINKEFGSFEAFIQEYVTNISRSGAFVKRAEPLPWAPEIDSPIHGDSWTTSKPSKGVRQGGACAGRSARDGRCVYAYQPTTASICSSVC